MGSCVWVSGDVKESVLYRVPSWNEIGHRWDVDLGLIAAAILVVMLLAVWQCVRRRRRKKEERAVEEMRVTESAAVHYQQF